MLVAAVMGYTLGVWWVLGVVLLPFIFFRMALPRPSNRVLTPPKSDSFYEVNELGTSKKPSLRIERVLSELGFAAIYFLIVIVEADVLKVVAEYLWNQRQHPLMVFGICCFVLKLIAGDLRYFLKVPEFDLKVFLRE